MIHALGGSFTLSPACAAVARLRIAAVRDRGGRAPLFSEEVGGHDGVDVSSGAERHTLQSSMRIRRKGLRALHERDDAGRLPADLVARLRRILFRLQEVVHLGDANAPGSRPHALEGSRASRLSVRVTGIWRVVFRFEDGEAVHVDLIDYH